MQLRRIVEVEAACGHARQQVCPDTDLIEAVQQPAEN